MTETVHVERRYTTTFGAYVKHRVMERSNICAKEADIHQK